MLLSYSLTSLALTTAALAFQSAPSQNRTFTNPVLAGSFPDPSCIFLPDYFDGTFLCASSSFLAFPGLPLHASKDLVNWRLIGHVFNRPEQFYSFANITDQQFGVYAPTIRRHNGTFFLTTTVFGQPAYPYIDNIVFNSTDPFDELSWGMPVGTGGMTYDNSLFWDTNGTTYSQGSTGYGIQNCRVSADDQLEHCASLWNGTGGIAPEGPHMYFKDGYHYLMIAENGEAPKGPTKHHESIARSREIGGVYESNPSNPILSNVNSSEYFTGTGHADIFRDGNGNWWGLALATRSGPEFETYPMGRETVLFPVTWESGEWPVFSQIRGRMSGPLPPPCPEPPGVGPLNGAADVVDFTRGSKLPRHFVSWKFPDPSAYAISPPGHEGSLRLTPSLLNLTGDLANSSDHNRTFVARRQTDTLFTYSVDLTLPPQPAVGAEAGVSLFNTQEQHADLGLVMLAHGPHLRFRATHKTNSSIPTLTLPVPPAWLGHPIRFQIKALNLTHFSFSAGQVSPNRQSTVPLRRVAAFPGAAISGGYTGSFVGAFATSNGGGKGFADVFAQRWRYTPQGQYVGDDDWVFPE